VTLFVVPPRNSTVSVENEPAGAGYAAAEDECTGANTSDSVDGATGGDGTALQGTEGSTDRPPPSFRRRPTSVPCCWKRRSATVLPGPAPCSLGVRGTQSLDPARVWALHERPTGHDRMERTTGAIDQAPARAYRRRPAASRPVRAGRNRVRRQRTRRYKQERWRWDYA
jgi:hypothetical protein